MKKSNLEGLSNVFGSWENNNPTGEQLDKELKSIGLDPNEVEAEAEKRIKSIRTGHSPQKEEFDAFLLAAKRKKDRK